MNYWWLSDWLCLQKEIKIPLVSYILGVLCFAKSVL